MSNKLNILLLEDDPLDAELNITALEAEGYQCNWECVQTKDEFIVAIDQPDYDLILIDYNLPGFDGLTALDILRKNRLNIPAILVSGNLGEELAIESIKAGAVDYVHKDRIGRLVRSVKRALEENKLRVKEREQAEDLALFSKLNQAAIIGASISELIDILMVDMNIFSGKVGLNIFLLNEDQKYLEMQHFDLPAKVGKKLKKLLGTNLLSMRLKVDEQKRMQQALERGEKQILDSEEDIEKVILKLIAAIAPKKDDASLKKLASKVKKMFPTNAVAFLPLIVDNRKIGVLTFTHKEPLLEQGIQRMESIVAQVTEVFARKLAEEEIEELHRQQKLILDSAGEGIFGLDTEGQFTFVNPAAAEMLGYTAKEMLGKHCCGCFQQGKLGDNSGANGECPVSITYREGENIYRGRIDFWRKNGNSFPGLFSSTSIEKDGDLLGAVVTFQDISEQVEATRELARLAEVVKQASITVTITDLDGDMIYVNPFFEEASGFSAEDALGEKLSIVKSGFHDNTFYKKMWDSIASGKTWQGTFINKRKDGSIYHEDASIFPIKTKDGKIINYAAVKQDITERKRAEEQIRLQLSRLDSLHKIDTAISGSTDVNLILDVLLEQAQKELAVDSADLLLFKHSTQSLQSAARVGFGTEALTHSQLRLGKGLAGKVALERETIQIRDLREDSDLMKEYPELVGEGFVSYIGVPLLAKGKLKGVLEIYHRSLLEPDAEWLNFLDTLARQAAIAVDSITLYENLDKRNVELRLAYEATLEGWAHALELRDMETEGHSRRVTKLTTELAIAMGMDGRLMDHVRRGALLHDIGKMGISDDILKKEGPLTDEEWVQMKKHPVYAYEMLKEIIYLKPALDIPYSHHEKWDGSGYPLQLSGNAIPLAARIFAIIDVYDALKADRPYRKAWAEKKILAHIREQSGKHFDPQVVEAFFKMISEKA